MTPGARVQALTLTIFGRGGVSDGEDGEQEGKRARFLAPGLVAARRTAVPGAQLGVQQQERPIAACAVARSLATHLAGSW